MSTLKSTPKNSKATPNGNPFGLTAREAELAILAWKCIDAEPKASNESHPSTPKSHTDTNTLEHISSMEDEGRKKVTDSSLAPQPKQIDQQKLAKLAHIPQADSAGRAMRTIKAKIKEAPMPSGSDAGDAGTPSAPATPGDGSTAAVADPASPSLLASKKKKAAAGGKVAGRKRTMKETNGDDGDDAGDKKETDGGEGPKKGVKRVKATGVVTLKGQPNDGDVQFEAGEI